MSHCFALDFDEQKRSGLRYLYSSYQIEYRPNLVFQVGGHLDQTFQALIDRSRAPLDLKSIRTILGYRRRPRYRRTKRSADPPPHLRRKLAHILLACADLAHRLGRTFPGRWGSLVVLGDPGRAYLPRTGMIERARYIVPTRREPEDRNERDVIVWQVLGTRSD